MGAVERSLTVSERFLREVEDPIVAHAGGGQALAYRMRKDVAVVRTVATAADSIMLPPARAGAHVITVNKATKAMQVFGQPGDLINDVATATGISQMPASIVEYRCFIDGNWYSADLDAGFSGAFATVQGQEYTASTTQTQAAGTKIVTPIAVFTTVANPNDAATLPPAKAGMTIKVVCAGAATPLQVFPASQAQGGVTGGDQINAAGQNASVTIANTPAELEFTCTTDGQWWAVG